MLTSLGWIFFTGLVLGLAAKKVGLPPLVGMMAAGVVMGPYQLGILDESLLNIAPDLRQLALILILTRAGLSLDLNALKKVGRSAILMCFVPACFEIAGMTIFAHHLLGVSYLEGAIIGAVVGAVSPAVIVPRMIRLHEEGWGARKGILQMILAGASADDIFVIIIFTALTGLADSGTVPTVGMLLEIPVSIVTGIGFGWIVGKGLAYLYTTYIKDNTHMVLLCLAASFFLVELETRLEGVIPFSGLLGVMAAGLSIQQNSEQATNILSNCFSKLWIAGEIILFVLVGAAVDLKYAQMAGLAAVVAVLGALCVRALGVLLCTAGAGLNGKERIFCVLAYLPKATVQAAIGGVPLAMGLACGQMVLTVAVIAILVTAPLGAIAIDRSYSILLEKNLEKSVDK